LRHRPCAALLLWLLALGLRLLFLSGLDVGETLRADALSYAQLAWNLAHHGAYTTSMEPPRVPHTVWPPGYPLLLAPCFAGHDLRGGTAAALPAQVVVGSALPLLVVALGRRLVPAPLAWLAGLLAACSPALVTTPSFLVSETAFTLLLFGVLLALTGLLAQPTPARAAGAGMLCGALALVRSSGLGLPVVAALYLGIRRAGRERRRAAALLLLTAGLTVLPWEVRNRIVTSPGAPAPSYFARPLAEGIYPDLRFGNAHRGYAMEADPEFPEFSTSIAGTLAEAWERTLVAPGPHLRWHLAGRWLTLWEFGMIQSPPIHVYPVRHGLFRPASINPAGQDEPLAALYWLFRALYYLAVVPGVLIGAGLVVAQRWAPATRPSPAVELCYAVLAYTVLLHSVVIPEPRFLLPLRPVLFLLAAWTGCALAAHARRWRPALARVRSALRARAAGGRVVGRTAASIRLEARRLRSGRCGRRAVVAGAAVVTVVAIGSAGALHVARRLGDCAEYTALELDGTGPRGVADAALGRAQAAVACAPALATAHLRLGRLLEDRARFDEALASYRTAILLDQRLADAWLGEGRLLERREAWAPAALAYEQALAADPTRTEAAMLAGLLLHYRLGHPERAVEHYRTVLSRNPTHYGAHYQIALALLASGRTAEARQAWRAFVPLAEAAGDRAALARAPAVLHADGTFTTAQSRGRGARRAQSPLE
jgi:Flp pilus assembly protein TadD